MEGLHNRGNGNIPTTEAGRGFLVSHNNILLSWKITNLKCSTENNDLLFIFCCEDTFILLCHFLLFVNISFIHSFMDFVELIRANLGYLFSHILLFNPICTYKKWEIWYPKILTNSPVIIILGQRKKLSVKGYPTYPSTF